MRNTMSQMQACAVCEKSEPRFIDVPLSSWTDFARTACATPRTLAHCRRAVKNENVGLRYSVL